MTTHNRAPRRVGIETAVDSYAQWRGSQAGVSQHTINGELPGLRAFEVLCGQVHSVTHLDQLGFDVMAHWWLSTAGLAESTRATRLSQLRSFLSYCRQRDWIDGDPTALIRAKTAPAEARLRYTPTQLLNLLELAKYPRDRGVIAVGINLALRGGEIADLRIGDLHQDEGLLQVRISKTTDRHAMPISSDLNSELTRWLERYLTACPQAGRTSYLFPSMHLNPRTGKVTYRHDQPLRQPWVVVQRVLEAAGLPTEQEGVHTLRRSVAAIFFEQAEAEATFDSALVATMTLLHHSRPETTLRYIGKDQRRDALDKQMRGRPFLTAMATPHAGPVRRLQVVR